MDHESYFLQRYQTAIAHWTTVSRIFAEIIRTISLEQILAINEPERVNSNSLIDNCSSDNLMLSIRIKIMIS